MLALAPVFHHCRLANGSPDMRGRQDVTHDPSEPKRSPLGPVILAPAFNDPLADEREHFHGHQAEEERHLQPPRRKLAQ